MTALVLVDHDRIRVAAAGRSAVSRALPAPSPDASEAEVARWCDAVRDAVAEALPERDRRKTVLAIGLGLTEIAVPSLPPIDPARQRAMLERDGDRYFPIDGPVAVAWQDGFAFGIQAERVKLLRASLEQDGAVRAVVTIASLLARHGRDAGTRSRRWTMDAGPGERGMVRFEGPALREARRLPQGDAGALDGDALDDATLVTLLPAATDLAQAGPDAMLADAETRLVFAARRRHRWYRSGAGLLAATLLLAFALNTRQERALQEATRRHDAALDASGPARATRDRLRVVARERAQAAASGARPSLAATLDLLGRLLPADAFVERLEWDGDGWRIDGSAASAARLVPILDADPSLDRVRVLAASTRFVDRGRQRESFSIAFALRPAEGAAGRGTRAAAAVAHESGGARGDR